MTGHTYKAYISYSHRDEAWAKWLHRALESYRVPRKLVGSLTDAGEVPARVRPVFRDRDDLSSAADLAESVKRVLANSDNLIVVCSPDAVASHWVGEEIRRFARNGRTGRIFCIIVGGDPAASNSDQVCFPPALAEVGLQEPLAADVRKWADGKRGAKLKLVAGLLGLRLDDFLQRDLQRRRKRQTLTGLGVAAALALAVVTLTAQISERHEREKAEQLATFIVDLGERLKNDADLETLGLIGNEATRHLQNLDQDKLSPDTGKRVALAFRQMGRVSRFQGRSDEALKAFKRSRDLLARLSDKYAEDPDMLFELGQAEYYVGNLHFTQGRYNLALQSMQVYHRLTHALVDQDTDNPDWILELSYSHNNLAAIYMRSGKGMDETTLGHVAEAIRLMEIVVALKPGDEAVASGYATLLAWAADAQIEACNLAEAIKLRHKVLELAKFSSEADPGNNEAKKQHAFALTGLARVKALTGEAELAVENLQRVIAMLQALSAADPSNFHYRQEALYRRIMLARLLGETGQLDRAVNMMAGIESEIAELGNLAEQDHVPEEEYIDFMLQYIDAQLRLGDSDAAKNNLQTVIAMQLQNQDRGTTDVFEEHQIILARYLWWQLEGAREFESLPIIQSARQTTNIEYRSCIEADLAARMFVMEGQREHAAREVKYLTDRGYAEPSFIRFCRKHGLCS